VDLKDRFEDAAARSKNLPNQPNDILLKMYALYKQATQGDVAGSQPGLFDMVGRAKYDAWSEIAGMSNDDAMSEYVARVEQLEGD